MKIKPIGWTLPARRRSPVPKGLKPVKRRLATGEVRLYWYHRASGQRLKHDPSTADGLLEVAALDAQAKRLEAVHGFVSGSYAALWVAYTASEKWRTLKPRTRSDYQAVRDWIGPAAEKALLHTMKPSDILRLRDKAEAAKGRRFANYVVAVLSLTLEWGKDRDMVKTNVARATKKIARPKSARKVNRAWSIAEVKAFAEAAPPHVAVPFALALFAGMRQGDALMATWSAYDGTMLEWKASKNGEDCSAPVTGAFKTILDGAKAKRGDRVQICISSRGDAWTASGFRATFFKLIRDLVDEGKMKPGCTFHGLRHTIAACAREAGQSDFQVSAGIGDRSTAMAELYGRDADRADAQTGVLELVQKRFVGMKWKSQAEKCGTLPDGNSEET